jgi:hypothetical protein
MVGVVQAMGFLQLFGASLSPRLLASGFELDGSYHGLGAHAIRTFLDSLCAPLTPVRPSTLSTAPVAGKRIQKIEPNEKRRAAPQP